MIGLEFATPLAFALLPAPLLLLAFARPAPSEPGGPILPRSIEERVLARAATSAGARASWPSLAMAFAWVALVISLAGPRIAGAVAALPASGRDIMFALDLSGSMTKQDFKLDGAAVSRLDLVKHVGSELIRRREGDRIGLVVFAETALVAAPLSFDVRAVARTLGEMEIGLVGRSTAIGEGLGLALKRLADSAASSRIVILLSDGANNAGSSEPGAVAELAHRMGVTIFTIGLGEDATTASDPRDAVDLVALQRVAEIGGGTAFHARTSEDLDAAARAIEALAAGPAPAPPTIVFHDLWTYPAAAACAAAAALALASRTRR
jgi:Ca-activated chloride channel family protein